MLAFFLFAFVCYSDAINNRDQYNLLIHRLIESPAYPNVRNETEAVVMASILAKEFNKPHVGELLPTTDFNCSLTGRSNPRPTNARKLLPGDIDVVATIGDSVAAGFGALASSIFGVFTEYRGYSFSIGGQNDLSATATVPNILKKYNPNVMGFAVGNGGEDSANAKFNVAVTGARSYQLNEQITALYNKMVAANVDMQNDWKMISIFVGGNDLCDFCEDTTKNSPSNYAANVESALDTIKSKFPRTFVNVISPPDVTLLGEVTGGLCGLLHGFECTCSTNGQPTRSAHGQYTEGLMNLVKLEKYQVDDFYVAVQPFLFKLELPKGSDGNADKSYFAPDCFHFSGKAHQAAAVALWNNMCELADNKKTTWVVGEPISCPVDYLS